MFPAVAEAKVVHAEKVTCFPVGTTPPQAPVCVPEAVPASGDEVAIAKDKVDAPLEIRKGVPEALGDERVARATPEPPASAEDRGDIVVEHFLPEADISVARPRHRSAE
jgi:hypothetical protein